MPEKIFIDCGGHFGEGLEKYIDKYKISDDWRVFSFEPNHRSFQELVKNEKIKGNVKFIEKAVWIYDGTVQFNAEFPPGTDNSDGEGSSLLSLDYWKPKSDSNPGAGDVFDTYDVECIDLSKFVLDNFKKDDFILLKMDIEGAEFDILRKMIDDKSVAYINDLYIEFHSFCYSKENAETTNEIIEKIHEVSNNSVNIYQN